VVVDDGLSLLARGLAGQDARSQSRGQGYQAEGFQVRVQVGGAVAGRLGRPQLGRYHVDHRVGVLGQGRDRQGRIGQRERQVGRIDDVEGAAVLVGGRLTKLDARFWWWFAISGLASLTPMPLRRHLARWLDSPAMLDRELMTLMWAGSRGYRMEPKFPAILTDGELRAITVRSC